jgi:hypothetical protein
VKHRLPSPLVWVPDEGQRYEIGQCVQWIREGNQSLIPDQLGPYFVESYELDPGLLPERWLRVQLRPAK